MRATDLLSATVVDERGHSLGRVHDIRIAPRQRGTHGGFQVVGLAIGGGQLAHAWGYAEHRATGPWLLRALTARSARRARFVPAERVADWGPEVVRIHGSGDTLPYLHDVVSE